MKGNQELTGALSLEDTLPQIRRRLMRWYHEHGRHGLPWRRTRDPWKVLLAELMLQRTRADLVAPVYEDTLRRFPTPDALATARPSAVRASLRPLGLSHRVPRIQAAAHSVRTGFPTTLEGLLQVPGVGLYAANATACFAFSRRVPIVDPSIIRILDRLGVVRSERSRPRDDPLIWNAASRLLPRRDARSWNYALLDLGARVCRRKAVCEACPLRLTCPSSGLE
jgi:A/G-specific adenine glycosylase